MKFRPFPCFALLALTLTASAQEKPLQERVAEIVDAVKQETKEVATVVEKKTRESWSATKAYVSEDAGEHRAAANARVKELTEEYATLQSRSDFHSAERPYLQTRIQALREHLEYAAAELQKLPTDAAHPRYAVGRKHFDETVNHLEKAVDQVRAELEPRQ